MTALKFTLSSLKMPPKVGSISKGGGVPRLLRNELSAEADTETGNEDSPTPLTTASNNSYLEVIQSSKDRSTEKAS